MKKILLNEKEYNMAFNFKVMKNICKELGLTMPQVMNGVQAMDLEIIGEILYQGIKVRHEDFEREVIDAQHAKILYNPSTDEVVKTDFSKDVKEVYLSSGTVLKAKTVIIATGAKAR